MKKEKKTVSKISKTKKRARKRPEKNKKITRKVKPKSKEWFRFLSEKIKKKSDEKKEIKYDHMIKTIIAEELMLRNPITIEASEPLEKALQLLSKYKLKSIIVVDNKKPIGLVNENKIFSLVSSSIDMKEGISEKNLKKFDKLLKIPIADITISIDQPIKKTNSLEEAIKIMNLYGIDQIPIVNENGELIGTLLEEDILRFIEKSVSEQKLIKKDVIETGIDRLFELISREGSITSKEAAKRLNIPLSEVEKFGRILESHGLINIDFSTIGSIKLIKKEREEF